MIYLIIGITVIITTTIIICNKAKHKKKHTIIEYQNSNASKMGPEYQSRAGKWTPSGWVFDNETQSWQSPDYPPVDQEKEARLAKYKEYHKDRPPTFEEWKATKEQHPGE